MQKLDEIGDAGSILNLRNGPDSETFEADYLHFPMSNKIEKYDTSQKEVRIWLNQIVQTFESSDLKYPVFIHCLSGKDRTSIGICAILLILGIKKETIIEEYLLSEGDVQVAWITLALDGMLELNTYFSKIDLDLVRKNLERKLVAVT